MRILVALVSLYGVQAFPGTPLEPPQYTREITGFTVRKQCGETCGFQAIVTGLEDAIFRNTGRRIEISLSDILYTRLKYAAEEALFLDDEVRFHFLPKAIKASGNERVSPEEQILSHGIMPDFWKVDVDSVSMQLVQDLQDLVNASRAAWEQVKLSLTGNEDPQAIEFKTRFQKKVDQVIFERLQSVPPEQFVFEGKIYTRSTFHHAWMPREADLHVIRSRYAAQSPDIRSGEYLKAMRERFNRGDKPFGRLPIEDIEYLVARSIDRRIPVRIYLIHCPGQRDRATGWIYAPKPGESCENDGMAHQFLVVGYREDPETREVSHLKLLDSWGPEVGDRGYFHLEMGYFRSEFLSLNMSIPLLVESPRAVGVSEACEGHLQSLVFGIKRALKLN